MEITVIPLETKKKYAFVFSEMITEEQSKEFYKKLRKAEKMKHSIILIGGVEVKRI